MPQYDDDVRMDSNRRLFIARHGETVFNAASRLQGDHPHTPLTRAGFAQADAMGSALRKALGARPAITLWASPTGRALQTLAVIAEHLELDWHAARTDARLGEIAMSGWSGRYYHEVIADHGPILDAKTGLFAMRPPGGEWYDDIAARLRAWLDDTESEGGDRLIVSHGITSRVLRGMLTGMADAPEANAPIAPGLPQGSVVMIAGGSESVVALGTGRAPA